MKIDKYGTVTVGPDKIIISGFHVDGEGAGGVYGIASVEILKWSRDRIDHEIRLITEARRDR